MIEYLKGQLIEKTPTRVVVLAGGVGYGLFVSLATYEDLPGLEEEVSLYTYLSVREDAMVLFGFGLRDERELFVRLTGVSGVGPKTAIGMLSGMGPAQLREHIAAGNATALTALPGIGKKSAERITLELRDKIEAVAPTATDGTPGSPSMTRALLRSDALAALLELGYGRSMAERAMRAALKDDPSLDESVEVLIKGALQQMQR